MYENKVWYCAYELTNYNWVYFTVNTSNFDLEMSELYYMHILYKTKEVWFDFVEEVERSEDLSAATIT